MKARTVPDSRATSAGMTSQNFLPLVLFRAAAFAPDMLAPDFAEFTSGRAIGATRWLNPG